MLQQNNLHLSAEGIFESYVQVAVCEVGLVMNFVLTGKTCKIYFCWSTNHSEN
jgi:hypothetical protein